MYRFRALNLLWILPISWIDAKRLRKKEFSTRFSYLQKWCRKVFRAFQVHMEIELEEKLPENEPVLFVSNHQSEFDILFLLAALPRPFTFVSKKENSKVPFVSSWSKTLELIFFDRDDQNSAIHMLRESARWLKQGNSLLIFPEGTRSKRKKMLPMHAGSLQPAFMAKACIVPVVLQNSYDYKQLIKNKKTAYMKILKPICFEEYKKLKPEGLKEVLEKRMSEALEDKK